MKSTTDLIVRIAVDGDVLIAYSERRLENSRRNSVRVVVAQPPRVKGDNESVVFRHDIFCDPVVMLQLLGRYAIEVAQDHLLVGYVVSDIPPLGRQRNLIRRAVHASVGRGCLEPNSTPLKHDPNIGSGLGTGEFEAQLQECHGQIHLPVSGIESRSELLYELGIGVGLKPLP